ncbi:MAG: hypothetical protein MKZ77_12185, partial [Acidimicrobiales bacterium]|nr:hypothetical protein [Acidimicrobiales bacterium]
MKREVPANQGNFRRTAGRQIMYLGLASLLGFGSLMWFLASLSGDVSSTALDEVAGSVSLALSEEPQQLYSSRAPDSGSGASG